MLTAEAKQVRRHYLTASDVGILMSGNKEKIYQVWMEKTEHPHYIEPDLSDVWPVYRGERSEELHLDWVQRKLGPIIRRGEFFTKDDWMGFTADGIVEKQSAVIECKWVGGREPFDTIRDRYFGQVCWQSLIFGCKYGILSVIDGANEPRQEIIELDQTYVDELIQRGRQFWQHVLAKTPPVQIDPIPVPATPIREVCFDGSNVWAAAASDWYEHGEASRKWNAACKQIRDLVDDDVAKAYGHGIEVLRDKAGRLHIKGRR